MTLNLEFVSVNRDISLIATGQLASVIFKKGVIFLYVYINAPNIKFITILSLFNFKVMITLMIASCIFLF